MKNNDKLVRFLIIFFLGWFGIHKFMEKKTGIGLIYLFSGGIFGIGWLIDVIKSLIDLCSMNNNKVNSIDLVQDRMHTTTAVNDNIEINKSEKDLSKDKVRRCNDKFAFLDDYNRYLKYEYYDVEVKGVEHRDFDISSIKVGHQLYFEFEPENQYDSNAIKILYDDIFIGYIPKNNLQDMVKDYADGEERQVCGFTTFVDEINKKIQIGLGFYRKLTDEELEEIPHIDATLIKTTKKDEFDMSRQDYLSTLSEDDVVSIDAQIDSDLYLVTDDCGNELGELNESVSEKISEYEYDSSSYAVVKEIKETSSGNLTAKIRIFFREEK